MENLGTVVKSSTQQFIQGTHFFFLGIRLIMRPHLRRYLFVPLIINALILLSIFSLLGTFFYHHLYAVTGDLPSWLVFIFGWLFWILYGFMSLLISTLIFTLLANLIASPFYGLLAEATAELLHEKKPKLLPYDSPNLQLKTILLMVPHALGRELQKLLYFLPWLLLCLVCLIFPMTWPLFPFLWWAVLTWILSVEYIDYQPDNQSIPFKQMLKALKENVPTVFGFGSMVSLAMLIPGANLCVPAVAVTGGTALWLSIQPKYRLNYDYGDQQSKRKNI